MAGVKTNAAKAHYVKNSFRTEAQFPIIRKGLEQDKTILGRSKGGRQSRDVR